MGPRPDGRGTFRQAEGQRHIAGLQWGRDRMAAERRSTRPACPSTACFNGAATGWPRNALRISFRLSLFRSFNGAATGWPRNAC